MRQVSLVALALGTMLAFTYFGGAFDQVTARNNPDSISRTYIAGISPETGRMRAPGAIPSSVPGSGEESQSSNWQPDIEAARNYASRREGSISFTLSTRQRSWGMGQAEQAPAASTIKVMLMAAYLNLDTVRTRPLDSGEQSLLQAMIRYSDNEAANQVSSTVGSDAVGSLASEAGMTDFQYSPVWGLSRTTTRDYGRLMIGLPELIPARHRSFALNELGSISADHRWGIAEVVPTGWKIRFKGGWGISDGEYTGTVSHQIAVLSRGKRRIGLAIQTQDNPTVEYGNETIRAVAKRLLRGLSQA